MAQKPVLALGGKPGSGFGCQSSVLGLLESLLVGFRERVAQENQGNQGNLVCLFIPSVGCFLGWSEAPPDLRASNVAYTCWRDSQDQCYSFFGKIQAVTY